MRIIKSIGNIELWQREKTLFLVSKMAPFSCYENVFRWVDSLTQDVTVVCFNTSELESEVLKALLVNRIPTILVVMKSFQDKYNVQIEQALDENRLLIQVMLREESDGKGTTPHLRNKYIISQVQHIVCGYVNPMGTIYLILAENPNVVYLNGSAVSRAAERAPKPFRWTVGEDKRLLRMFYEDMGIHAIHKALNRPYSTIYTRTKALTMNDEVLKGREFEDYVVAFFDLPHNEKLSLKEWRGDKSLPGIYPESNSDPDLVFSYDDRPFAIECKWRNYISRNIGKDILPPERKAFFEQYAKEHNMPVYLLLGIGGLPSDPDSMHLVEFSETISAETLKHNTVSDSAEILQKILHY